MSNYEKIENRFYKLEEDCVVKATYNKEDKEYSVCGTWTIEEFLAHKTPFDANTEAEYDSIKTALSLE